MLQKDLPAAVRRVRRRTALSERDWLTMVVLGALWLYMTARSVLLVVAVPRWWAAALAMSGFFTWFCWICVTYRRVALYVAPFLGLVSVMSVAMGTVFHPEQVARLPVAACGVGLVLGVIFIRRKLYS